MTMKWLLTQLDLNETYQGGVGSYMLFTMCLAHLQAEMRARGHGFLQEANLGYLVYGFLERYTTFDYYFNGIDVRWEGSLFDKQEMHRDEAPQPLLCIKSPLEPELDVGKNSYKFAEVVDRFKWRLEVSKVARIFEYDIKTYTHNKFVLCLRLSCLYAILLISEIGYNSRGRKRSDEK